MVVRQIVKFQLFTSFTSPFMSHSQMSSPLFIDPCESVNTVLPLHFASVEQIDKQVKTDKTKPYHLYKAAILERFYHTIFAEQIHGVQNICYL